MTIKYQVAGTEIKESPALTEELLPKAGLQSVMNVQAKRSVELSLSRSGDQAIEIDAEDDDIVEIQRLAGMND